MTDRRKIAGVIVILLVYANAIVLSYYYGVSRTESQTIATPEPELMISAYAICGNFTVYNLTWQYWSTNRQPTERSDVLLCALGLYARVPDGYHVTLSTTFNLSRMPWILHNLTIERVVIYGSIFGGRGIDEHGNSWYNRHPVSLSLFANESGTLVTDDSVQIVFWGYGTISVPNSLAVASTIEISQTWQEPAPITKEPPTPGSIEPVTPRGGE